MHHNRLLPYVPWRLLNQRLFTLGNLEGSGVKLFEPIERFVRLESC